MKVDWNLYLDEQIEICRKYNSEFVPFDKNAIVAVSENLNLDPINALRHKSENGTTGWYIWSGNFSEEDNFFKPICVEHLYQCNPELLKYLGLKPGFRFLIGKKNYVDIWFDEKLL